MRLALLHCGTYPRKLMVGLLIQNSSWGGCAYKSKTILRNTQLAFFSKAVNFQTWERKKIFFLGLILPDFFLKKTISLLCCTVVLINSQLVNAWVPNYLRFPTLFLIGFMSFCPSHISCPFFSPFTHPFSSLSSYSFSPHIFSPLFSLFFCPFLSPSIWILQTLGKGGFPLNLNLQNQGKQAFLCNFNLKNMEMGDFPSTQTHKMASERFSPSI